MHQFLLPPAEEQAGYEETAGEKAGQAALHSVVMKESQHAVDSPSDG
jgi:hypothetical protein